MIFYMDDYIVTMYLRTSKRKNRDGSTVSYLQIAENVWDPVRKRSKARVVCSLGRADGRAQERLRQLAASIRRHASFETISELEPGWRFIDGWEHGPFHVLSALWEDLGIRDLIADAVKEEDRKVDLERAVFAMVANRCLAPSSKLCCYESWLAEDVYFPEGEGIKLHHLYRAMDLLSRHKEEVEELLYWHMADLLSMDVDLIFYDTTSVYFEIDDEDEAEDGLRMRGYSKDGRGDRPQVVVGMAVTRDGFPVKSWVFPGNMADVTTIERVKSDLRGWRLNRCMFVADAGMVSEDSLRVIAGGGMRYVVAVACRRGTEVVNEVISRPGRFREVAHNLRVKEVWTGSGVRRRRYVVCFNPQEAKRQREHRAQVLAELEQELASVGSGRAGPHPKRACELMASRRYGPYLRKLKNGRLKVNKGAVRERERRDGLWVIRTNDEELSAEDLALAYKQLIRVEQTWKTMKSGLKVRPMFHRSPGRIEAHVFLCVLALLLERVAEARCKESWRRIRRKLGTIKVGQLFTPNGTVFQTSPAGSKARNVLKKLKIDPPPEVLEVTSTGQ
jgi:transposase